MCNIIHVDACHVLLGRPWKFGRKEIHDGHANTYSLTKDLVRHKLKPLREEMGKNCSNARISLVDARMFLDGLKHENVCFGLIPKLTKKMWKMFLWKL